MPDHATIGTRIADARERLGSKLHGLHRRITHARVMISPGTYVGNPWIRFGAAVAVGYKLGCPAQPKLETSRPDQLQSLVRSLLRTVLLNLATSAIHDVMRRPTTES